MKRPRRLRGLSINALIPNAVTVLGMCAGLSSIRYALAERWEFAVGLILLAGIIDGLDGRIARVLKASSDFGAELDSLSDFVCFGVAPAMVLYLGDHLEGVVTFEVADGRITNFYAMRNPEKLASVMVPRQIGR